MLGQRRPRAADAANAFSEWIRPHLPAMARLAARLAPPAESDDVVQEAMTRAWLKRGQFDPNRGTASGWLLAITADQARKATRRRRFFAAFRDQPATTTTPDERLDLRDALRALTNRQRLAVDCYYYVGLSVADTAAVMHCSEGTVKSTLSDARARLRPLLEVDDA